MQRPVLERRDDWLTAALGRLLIGRARDWPDLIFTAATLLVQVFLGSWRDIEQKNLTSLRE